MARVPPHGERSSARYVGGAAEAVFFAPGRVNVIGERIDDHGGLVLLPRMLVEKRQREMSDLALALAAQWVEHWFLGTPCGIMDQYAVANGCEGQAMLLNCSTLECRYLPFFAEGDSWRLWIVNTNRPRQLAESEYSLRCEQCRLVLRAVNKFGNGQAVTLCQLEEGEVGRLTNELLRKGARHVTSEHRRTQQAAQAWNARDTKLLGACLSESHRSLRDDYQVSRSELDMLVDVLCRSDRVAGARMTGAGFGYPPHFYRGQPGVGVRLPSATR